MHELAITESILNIAVDEAKKHGARKVLRIKIKVGEFSEVVPQLIQEYYNIVSKDTVAEEAELVFEKVPVTIRCNDCGKESVIERENIKCPHCGSMNIRMVTGREFYIDSMEVD